MKKILIFIGLVICFTAKSQDSKVSALSEDTDISGDEYLYNIESGTSYKMDIETLLDVVGDSTAVVQNALEDSASDLRDYVDAVGGGSGYFIKRTGTSGGNESRTLVPKDGPNWLGLYLGSDPGSYYTSYRLHTTGKSYFSDTVVVAGEKPIFFNSSTVGMARYSDSLIFWDIYADTANLKELLELPNNLTGHTTVNTGVYDLKFVNGDDDGYFFDYSTDILKLSAGDEVQIVADDITLSATSATGGIDLLTNYDAGNDVGISWHLINVGGDTRAELRTPMLFIWPTDDPVYDVDADGYIYYDDSEDMLKYSNGAGYWTTIDTVGGGGSGTPAGNDGDIQMNNSGSFGVTSYLNDTNVYFDSDYNTSFGQLSMDGITSGALNTGVGNQSMQSLSSGDDNVGVGNESLQANSTGSGNTAVGSASLDDNSSGSNNIGIGYNAGKNQTNLSNRLYINSIDRTNILEDTTKSIIYGYQAAATADQILYINANTVVSDSLFLPALDDAEGDEQWAGISINNAVFGDSLTDAGFMLRLKLKPIDEYMADVRYNEKTGFDELLWSYWNGKEVVSEYTIKGRPNKTIQKLQSGIERSFMYILQLEMDKRKLEEENKDMKVRIYDIEERLKALEKQ